METSKRALTFIFNICLITFLFISCGNHQHVHDHKSEHVHEHEHNADHEHNHDEMTKPVMAHNVYFWVKEGTSEEDRLAFEKGLEKLGTVPSLQTYYWGKPAPTEDRNVIDNTYHYSINSLFASLMRILSSMSHKV